jgi:hypothetical protein
MKRDRYLDERQEQNARLREGREDIEGVSEQGVSRLHP